MADEAENGEVENESSIPGHNPPYAEGGAHETSPPRRTAVEEANVGEVGKLAGSVEPLKLPDETVPTEAVEAEEPESEDE